MANTRSHFPEGYGEPSVPHRVPKQPEVAPQGNHSNITSLSSTLEVTTENFFLDWLWGCDDNGTSTCVYNNTLLFNGTVFESTKTNVSEDDLLRVPELRLWPLFLLIFPFFTVFGNVLVIMSVYRERSLRTVTNYFICSLAIADIMVAVLVMPFAVYWEVVQKWLLSDPLCDAYVAFDVLSCTASILNLTAISVDRFIAVTQPIKYSKHRNSKRVFVTIALTWVISVGIAAPIALGVNYSHLRMPGDCTFFNSDFIIYSSMGSFYIPSLIMIFLYWRIYRVLHLRARAQAQSKKAKTLRQQVSAANVIANPATMIAINAEPTVTTGLTRSLDNGKLYHTTDRGGNRNQLSLPIPEDDTLTNTQTNTDSQSSERYHDNDDESMPKSPASVDDMDDENENKSGGLIVNRVAIRDVEVQIGGNGNGLCNTVSLCHENETKFCKHPVQKIVVDHPTDESSGGKNNSPVARKNRRKDKKFGGKFNLHMRTSRKRKEKSSSKREKKATKTLAIVLGVFLLCWVPFFTINIINAICIRYELFESPVCNIHAILFSFFVWLGYINSFLNPVIYTIFNPEFRKAFKKILTEKC